MGRFKHPLLQELSGKRPREQNACRARAAGCGLCCLCGEGGEVEAPSLSRAWVPVSLEMRGPGRNMFSAGTRELGLNVLEPEYVLSYCYHSVDLLDAGLAHAGEHWAHSNCAQLFYKRHRTAAAQQAEQAAMAAAAAAAPPPPAAPPAVVGGAAAAAAAGVAAADLPEAAAAEADGAAALDPETNPADVFEMYPPLFGAVGGQEPQQVLTRAHAATQELLARALSASKKYEKRANQLQSEVDAAAAARAAEASAAAESKDATQAFLLKLTAELDATKGQLVYLTKGLQKVRGGEHSPIWL